MNLPRSTAAGRLTRVGPRLLLLAPPSARGFGALALFAAAGTPRPDDAPPGWLPDLTGDAAFACYRTPAGVALLLYLCTRRDHPGLTLDDAAGLAAELDEAAVSALVEAAFVRERRPPRPGSTPPASRPGRGVHEADFGALFGGETLGKFPPQVLAEMSLDQIDLVLSAGRAEPEDALSFEEVMRIYHEYRPTARGG